MNFEKLPKIEQIGKNRDKLLALEKEGKYVFHGSPDQIRVLKPKQAEKENEETGKMEMDGEPAVFATPYVDIAIFRSLINRKDFEGDSESAFGIDGDQLYFSATSNLLEVAKRKIGKVYVLDKRRFEKYEGIQCQSYESIIPIEVIEVTIDDLPNNIKAIK